MRAGTGSNARSETPRHRARWIAAAVLGTLLSIPLAGCGPADEPEAERPGPTVGHEPAPDDGQAEGRVALVDRPWRAIGTEPFWGLEVSDHGIVFTEPAADPVVFPPAPPRMEGGAAVLTTQIDQRLLHVSVRDTACSDGMSDREYEYAVRVVLDGEALQGCALPDSTPQMRAVPDPGAE